MKNFTNTAESYGYIAIAFHWLMAVLIIGMLALGLYMTNIEGPERALYYGWHKALGVIILGLAVLRLSWRLASIIPSLPATSPRWQRLAATTSHWLLYALMIAMPVTGWLLSSAAGKPISVFGWFTLPTLIDPNPLWRPWFGASHSWLAYGLIALLVLHVSAAMMHHFFYKDNVLRRML